jgi:hypothetical protein
VLFDALPLGRREGPFACLMHEIGAIDGGDGDVVADALASSGRSGQ